MRWRVSPRLFLSNQAISRNARVNDSGRSAYLTSWSGSGKGAKKTPARTKPGGRKMKISVFLKGRALLGSRGADSAASRQMIVRQRQKRGLWPTGGDRRDESRSVGSRRTPVAHGICTAREVDSKKAPGRVSSGGHVRLEQLRSSLLVPSIKNGVAASGWNADGDGLLVFSAALIRKMQIDPVDPCWPAARSWRALNYVA